MIIEMLIEIHSTIYEVFLSYKYIYVHIIELKYIQVFRQNILFIGNIRLKTS